MDIGSSLNYPINTSDLGYTWLRPVREVSIAHQRREPTGLDIRNRPITGGGTSRPAPVPRQIAHPPRNTFHSPERLPLAAPKPPHKIPQKSIARVPVTMDSVFRVLELLGALQAHRERFNAIRARAQGSLTEFLACIDAELSKTRAASTLTPEGWSSARKSALEVELAR